MDDVVIKDWRRRIGVRRAGHPSGFPVFLLHGTPGCRIIVQPSESDLYRLGVNLITYDRPGYGRSDPHPGRVVADAADDVRAIADYYGLERFAVIGRSGGGPHALACAALLPDRVTRAASLVGLAPIDAPGLDWLQGMVELNRSHYGAARRGLRYLAPLIYPQVVAMRADPEHLIRRLEADSDPPDREVLRDPQFRAAMIESMTEAVSRSLDGWAADHFAFTRPWGFDPGWIGVPTLLLHGATDVFTPVAHARWLASRIRHASLVLAAQASHLSASALQCQAIEWLLHGSSPDLAAG